MDQSTNKELVFKQELASFIKENKFKIITILVLIITSIIVLLILHERKESENISLSEKYIKAGLLLSNNKNFEAKNKYVEIILSKNKFYSLLALNTILEKNLVKEKEKMLEYFLILEKINYSKELYNLILLKKYLYLFKEQDYDAGKKILNNLINEDSNLKSTAQQLIK